MQQITPAAGEQSSVFAPDVDIAVDEAAARNIGAGVTQEPIRPARPVVKPHRHVEAGRDVVRLLFQPAMPAWPLDRVDQQQ